MREFVESLSRGEGNYVGFFERELYACQPACGAVRCPRRRPGLLLPIKIDKTGAPREKGLRPYLNGIANGTDADSAIAKERPAVSSLLFSRSPLAADRGNNSTFLLQFSESFVHFLAVCIQDLGDVSG